LKWIVKPGLINLNRNLAVCRVSPGDTRCQANSYSLVIHRQKGGAETRPAGRLAAKKAMKTPVFQTIENIPGGYATSLPSRYRCRSLPTLWAGTVGGRKAAWSHFQRFFRS